MQGEVCRRLACLGGPLHSGGSKQLPMCDQVMAASSALVPLDAAAMSLSASPPLPHERELVKASLCLRRQQHREWPTGRSWAQAPAFAATVAAAAVAAAAVASGWRPTVATVLINGDRERSPSEQLREPEDIRRVRRRVDYVIDSEWANSSTSRAYELKPPAETRAEAEGRDSFLSGPARRLLMPLRLEDVEFLRLLNVDNLRVELWPHRSPEPHVHVRVFTDAIAFYPPPVARKRWLLGRLFAPRRQWFLFFQALVHLPQGAALLGCTPEWRWAEFSESEVHLREAISGAFRVLEVSCPRRPRGFLSPPFSRSEGPKAPRDVLLGCFRFAFLALLVAACVAQIVLLLICVVMLLVQVRRGRPRL